MVFYLISHCYENGQQKPVTCPNKFLLHFYFGQRQKVPRKLGQNWYCDHKIITVSLYEIVSRYTGGIYVMLTKRS